MGNTADMPKLKKKFTAGLMNGFGHSLPAFDLRFRVYARRTGIAQALRRNLAAFRDNKARTRSLPVILDVHSLRCIALTGAVAGQRRHDDTVCKS